MTSRTYDLLSIDKCSYFDKKNCALDVTSVVETLENTGFPLKCINDTSDKTNNYFLDNIKNFETWLNGSLYPSLYTIKQADVNRVLNSLGILHSRIANILKIVRIARTARKSKANSFDFVCKCEKIVEVPKTEHAWTILQEHEHFEEMLCLGTLAPDEPADECDETEQMFSHTCSPSSSSTVSDVESLLSEEEEGTATATTTTTTTTRSGTSEENDMTVFDMNSTSPVNSSEVLQVMYPVEVMQNVSKLENNYQFYTIQKLNAIQFRCLLCKVELSSESNVYEHVVGAAHTRALANQATVTRLKCFHMIFSTHLAPELLMHIGLFLPHERKDMLNCKLCFVGVRISNFEEHIETGTHLNRLSQKKPQSYFFYKRILEMQEQPSSNGTTVMPHQNQTEPQPSVMITHNIVPAMNNSVHTTLDLLEHRFKLHKVFIKYFGKTPVCVPCTTPLSDTKNSIKAHFLTREHNRKANTAYFTYSYLCDICSIEVHTEFKWISHLQSRIHKEKLTAGGATPLHEYECTSCNYVIFGNEESLEKHRQKPPKKVKKGRVNKEVKLPAQLKTVLEDQVRLSNLVEKVVGESQKVLSEKHLSVACCRAIEDALKPEFGRVTAFPFGSRISGLGSTASDLDVFVEVNMMYVGDVGQDAETQARLVKRTAAILKKHPHFTDVTAIPSARTPIVQVYHKVTGLDCDLSFRHGLSVENTQFLQLCIDVQPLLRELILVLKHWSNLCRLNVKISTYALSMLVIFYMQVQGYLPSVKTLRTVDPTKPLTIAGWKSFCFTKPVSALKPHINECRLRVRELLWGFFNFYVRFDFDKEVVCPLLGKSVLKTNFHNNKGKNLPREMSAYVSKINSKTEFEVFRSTAPICIQDPFDLSHNLAKASTNELLKKFVTLCKLSLEAMG